MAAGGGGVATPTIVFDPQTDDLGPGPPIDQIGWHGEYSYDDAEVAALRRFLSARNGIDGLEMVDPLADPAGFA
eukprot:SAG31_NODE_9476_length_1271_cov_1.250000_1_plen_73_part_01